MRFQSFDQNFLSFRTIFWKELRVQVKEGPSKTQMNPTEARTQRIRIVVDVHDKTWLFPKTIWW